MELMFLPSFSILFSFFLFVIMVTKLLNISKRESSAPGRLPPGPWKLPFIGNLHQMVGLLPHQTLRNLSEKHGPLMHLQLGEVSAIVVSSPQMAREVMKTHDVTFATRPQVLLSQIICYDSTDIVFAPCGPYWRQLRKICTLELLSKRRVESFQSIREEEVSSFIKSISSSVGTVINLSDKIASLTCGVTARAAFGKKSDEPEQFIAFVAEVIKLGSGFYLSDMFPSIKALEQISGIKSKLEKMHVFADKLLEAIIDDHKTARIHESTRKGIGEGEHVDDLVDVLLKYQDGGYSTDLPLTSDNIKAVIFNMFAGGTETSSTTTGWAMAELLKNPGMMKKAQDEVRQVFDNKNGKIDEADFHLLKYLKLVIKEVLRLHPASPLLAPRESGERCEIEGYEIPAKTKVIVNAWAIGRDPDYWSDPDSFYPERFEGSLIDYKGTSFEYIPFGAGRRVCPGITFGLMNVESQLVHMLYHFDWKLPDGIMPEDFDMTEEFTTIVRRKKELLVIPIAYHKSSIA